LEGKNFATVNLLIGETTKAIDSNTPTIIISHFTTLAMISSICDFGLPVLTN
jgi:hypothetical protein